MLVGCRAGRTLVTEKIEAIDKGLDPFKKLLKREVTRDDIIRLTEIRIKRISKYDSFRADEEIKGLEDRIAETEKNIRKEKRAFIFAAVFLKN